MPLDADCVGARATLLPRFGDASERVSDARRSSSGDSGGGAVRCAIDAIGCEDRGKSVNAQN